MPVIFFGDQIADLAGSLRKVHQSRDGTVLVQSFLESSARALREEVGALPRALRDRIPSFTSIFDLVERHIRSEKRNPALENALLCVCHLANFIGYFEQQPDQYLRPDESCILGLGVGLLSASAVACSRTLADLPLIAVKIVRIAFNLGTVVGRVSEQFHPHDEAKESWSLIVSEVTEAKVQAELDAFHTRMNIPNPGRAYVSIIGGGACTVSGRPSRLRQLARESEFFKDAKTPEISTYGLYNARHIYSESEVQAIIGSNIDHVRTVLPPCRSVLSTVTGEELIASSALQLVQLVVEEILTQPIRWDTLRHGAAGMINGLDSFDGRVLAFTTTHAASSLISALKSGSQRDVVMEDIDAWSSASELIQPRGRFNNSKIAIVGMSGRFPGASSVDGLWQLLEQGLDVHKTIPKDRFNVETHFDPTGKRTNTSHTPYGCFIEEPGLFDPRFFNMSPREAAQTDPMHRLALATAYEALEMSGFVPNRTPSTQLSRVGTFYGQTSDDWREVNAAQHIETYFIPGGVRAFAPGRISYYFKFSGPSYSVDTACSSSLAAIQIACTSLWNGECDTAVAGGVNVLTAPDIFAGLSRGQFLSKTGSCKTWDSNADGYCRADGVGSIVLKRLEDAEADKDNILGVVLGSATNHSADAISITHPHAGNQSYLYESILHSAGVDASDVSYVEMHGTGTQAGDITEMRSVTDVFVRKDGKRRRDQPLHIGAIKANIGHGESAAGVTALIKMLLMLQHNAIPPHVGIKNALNPGFPNLKELNVQIPFQKVDWLPVNGKPRVAFLNNFSAAGGNTALLIQDGPKRAIPANTDARPVHTIAVSAKSISSLERNIKQLISYVEQNPEVPLPSLAYTTTARRMHHNYRVAVSVSNLKELKEAFVTRLGDGKFTPISSKTPKVAFIFTGQGAFYPRLGRQLYETCSQFQTDIKYLDNLVKTLELPSILPAVEGTSEKAEELSPLVVQLALVCVQIALVKLWNSWGIRPDVVIGHSLGEYAALNAAGVLSVDDTIYLVGQRAKLLQQKCVVGTHAMLAVKASLSAIEKAANGSSFEVACINTAKDTAISGTISEIDEIKQVLGQAGYKSMKLDLPYAFHSAQVEPILDSFQSIADGVIFNPPRIPVISPLLGKVLHDGEELNATYLRCHARDPVNFLDAVRLAQDEGILDAATVCVEVGPHPVCSAMIKSILETENVMVPSLRKSEDPWMTLSTSVCLAHCSGLRINWSEFQQDQEASHQLLNLPSYSFDDKRYWIDYVNDWCLTKTEPRITSVIEDTKPETPKSNFSTSTVHRVVEEEFEHETGKVVVQSDLSNPIFRTLVSGHMVNDNCLCPSSIFADIAYTLADYSYKRLRPDQAKADIDVGQMEVAKPLILKNNGFEQTLQVTIMTDLNSSRGTIRYVSVNPQNEEVVEHAKCVVTYANASDWLSTWTPHAYLIEGRIESLKDAVAKGKAHQISRGLVYKLFGAAVQYDEKYQGINEVTLDSARFEATSRVTFKTTEKDGSFHFSPYWIDSLAHLSGFILNGSDAVDSKKFVYISHGWKSMRFAKELSPTGKYEAYVKMQSAGENVMAGDVYVLEDDIIIGVVGGLKFQRIPRQALNLLLPPANALTKKALADNSAALSSSPASMKKSKPTDMLRTLPQKRVKPAKHSKSSIRSHQASGKAKEKRSSKVATAALKIISSEADIDPSELLDECAFANLGVDSLLSLQIAGKFREDLDIDVPSSVFVDYATIGELRKYLSKFDHDSSSAAPSSASISSASASSASSSEEEDLDSDVSDSSALTTPSESDVSVVSNKARSKTIPTQEIASKKAVSDNSSGTTLLIRTTIADQMGIALEEVSGSNDLLSLGMDSLMSICILGALREQTNLTLPGSLFQDHPSIDAIEEFLGLKPKPAPRTRAKAASKGAANKKASSSPFPPAVSILMQGNPRTATKTLFLFPDGSGSATSYASIPNISPDVCVYGLNSPFMTTPEEFTIGIDGVAVLYLEEVRRRQPHGPYFFGGWSAGGIVAFEITQLLLRDGERVEKMIFFDSPCPVGLEALPARLHHFFNDIGLLGGGDKGPPSWLLAHFDASIKALSAYRAKPIADFSKAPKTLAIWAQHGVARYPTDPRPPPSANDPASMKWLLNNRTDFGFNGWDQLLGGENISTTSVEGNHFSMMKKPLIHKLAQLIEEALE
ncbi:hypothetical protein MMC07_003868 [Pseudocyphellaria aurata]|nr:hypothetical protein [Pseudocyphellaria aurata]